MSTTLIFAEFLSIGALTLISIGLMAVGVGLDPGLLLTLVSSGPFVGLTLALALAYPLGITVDGCADRLFRSVGETPSLKHGVPEKLSVLGLACDKTRWSEFAGKYFEYNRIKTRLARSFILNSAFMAFAGAAAGIRTHASNDIVLAWIVLWSLLAVGAWWTLLELRQTANRKLGEAWHAGAKSLLNDAQVHFDRTTPRTTGFAESTLHAGGEAMSRNSTAQPPAEESKK